jgi:hypothetical protein
VRRLLTPTLVELEDNYVLQVPLTQGLYALVDFAYHAAVSCYCWRAYKHRNTYYARTHQPCLADGSQRTLLLHQLIARLIGIDGPADHKNGDGLDCRAYNLRPGPALLNGANQRKQARRTSSIYKGVSFTRPGKWRAQLTLVGQCQHLGYFPTAEEAARAYDAEALRVWGDYACLNFPVVETNRILAPNTCSM